MLIIYSMKKNIILILLLITCLRAFTCTIGVASEEATLTNRPMLWKSRDLNSFSANTLRFVESLRYKFVVVATPNENRAWMGVNEMGFAIANSLSNDLTVGTGSLNNGNLIYNALGLSANLEGFENYLDYVINSSPETLELRGNFVVFDAEGNSRVYEVNNDNYWRYDTTPEQPYIIRSNFSVQGGSSNGYSRFIRSTEIISELVQDNELTVNNLLTKQIRDVYDQFPTAYELPWEYGDATPLIDTEESICRVNTISAVVIEGVREGQDPSLTTMWVIMSNPFTSYAVPVFPTVKVNQTTFNNISNHSPQLTNLLWNESNNYLLDTSYFVKPDGFSLLNSFKEIERETYNELEEMKIRWENNGISTAEIKEFINSKASEAYAFSSQLYTTFTPNQDVLEVPDNSITVYPNPFKERISIKANSTHREVASVKIYNLKGQLVKNFATTEFHNSELSWDGRDNQNRELASGIYLIRYQTDSYSTSKKVVLLK